MIPPGMQCAIGSYAKRLMVAARVWRKETTTDEGGGQVVDWVDQERTISVELASPTDTELQVAAQMGVTITHSAMMPLDAAISYGDRIEVDGELYQLQSDPLSSTHSAIARATVRKTPFDETTS